MKLWRKIYDSFITRVKEWVDFCIEHYETKSNLTIFSKKAGNARWKLLAYRSFYYIQTMQKGEVDLSNFL